MTDLGTPCTLVLNRFPVKTLTAADRTFRAYRCDFAPVPEGKDFHRRLAQIAYKVGVPAIALRSASCLLTREAIAPENLTGADWRLTPEPEHRVLNPRDGGDRQALASWERRFLARALPRLASKAQVERAAEGGLTWWVTDAAGVEKSGNGWEIHRGRHIDVHIDAEGTLALEVDLHYRFYTPRTLHWWLETYPDLEKDIRYVRNTYRKAGQTEPLGWLYQGWREESPEAVLLPKLNISLAAYHRQEGASETEIQNSRVVYVQRPFADGPPVAHLSQRLIPSLTLEMLAALAAQPDLPTAEKTELESVFACIRKDLKARLTESTVTANRIRAQVYRLTTPTQPLTVQGVQWPAATLLAKGDRPVQKIANVSRLGCAVSGETRLGCLNLFSNDAKYPDAVAKALTEIARSTGVSLSLDSYRTRQDYPEGAALDEARFWQTWADEGIRTVLVILTWSSPERKQRIRKEALRAGIATQFMVPQPKADAYKGLNVALGLLCKAGWQPVRLQVPAEGGEAWADLVVGFDTGTNRELYYGTSAYAVLADGQSLGWELPNVQTGEKFSGAVIWRTVSSLILQFEAKCGQPPRKILLLRDGLVQSHEFDETVRHLAEANIAVDVLGVRKSGTGRLGIVENEVYRDAPIGSTVLTDDGFLMVTSQAIRANLCSARPLRMVRAYGHTPLPTLALQTYHLSQLHPASGFRTARLPWVLHLADKTSQEWQRLRDINLLQNLDRSKLFAV